MLISLMTGIIGLARYLVVACVAGTAANILWLAGARAPRVAAHTDASEDPDQLKYNTVIAINDASQFASETQPQTPIVRSLLASPPLSEQGRDEEDQTDQSEPAAEIRARCIQVIKAGTARRIQLQMRSLARVPLVRSHSASGVPRIQKAESQVPEVYAESKLNTKVGLGISAVQGTSGAETEAWWRASTAAQMAGVEATARWANSALRKNIADMIKSRSEERLRAAENMVRDHGEVTTGGQPQVLNQDSGDAVAATSPGSPAALTPCNSVPKINIEAPSPGRPPVFSYAQAVKIMASPHSKLPSKSSKRGSSESKGKNTGAEGADEGGKENSFASSPSLDAEATLSWRRKVSRPAGKSPLFSALGSSQNAKTSWDGGKHNMNASGSKSAVQLR